MTSSNYLIPNSYQTPNALVDLIMPLLTDAEWRVLSWALRHILGFDDYRAHRRRRLSVSTFQHGYGPFPGCGLGKPAILNALAGLSQFGVMLKVGLPTSDGQEWELPLDPKHIDLKGLNVRLAAKSRSSKKQTSKARTAKSQERSVRQTTSAPRKSGLSNRPPIKAIAVCQTDHLWSVKQTASGLLNRRNQTDSQTHLQTHKKARYSRADVEASGLLVVPAGYWQALYVRMIVPQLIDAILRTESEAVEKKRVTTAIRDIIKAWVDATGNLDPNVWKNKTLRGYAESLDAAGFTASDVKDFVEDRQQEAFWRKTGVSLQVVARDISRWKSNRDDDDIEYFDYDGPDDAVDDAYGPDDEDDEYIDMPDEIRERLESMRKKVAV